MPALQPDAAEIEIVTRSFFERSGRVIKKGSGLL